MVFNIYGNFKLSPYLNPAFHLGSSHTEFKPLPPLNNFNARLVVELHFLRWCGSRFVSLGQHLNVTRFAELFYLFVI